MSYQVINPFIQFVDPINGKPLSGGSVYFGRQDSDPKNQPANRINVYAVQDNGTEVLLAQPITLNGAGQPQYSGSAKQLKIELYTGESAYCVQVFSSSGSQKGYSARVYPSLDPISGVTKDALADVASSIVIAGFQAKQLRLVDGIKQLTPQSGIAMQCKGYVSGKSYGGGFFYYDPALSKTLHNGGTIISPEAITAWNGTYADIVTMLNWTGTGSGCYVRVVGDDPIDILMFGADPSGVADSTVAVRSCLNAAKKIAQSVITYGINVFVPKGVYKTSGTITIPQYVNLTGESVTASIFECRFNADAFVDEVTAGGQTATWYFSKFENLSIFKSDVDGSNNTTGVAIRCRPYTTYNEFGPVRIYGGQYGIFVENVGYSLWNTWSKVVCYRQTIASIYKGQGSSADDFYSCSMAYAPICLDMAGTSFAVNAHGCAFEGYTNCAIQIDSGQISLHGGYAEQYAEGIDLIKATGTAQVDVIGMYLKGSSTGLSYLANMIGNSKVSFDKCQIVDFGGNPPVRGVFAANVNFGDNECRGLTNKLAKGVEYGTFTPTLTPTIAGNFSITYSRQAGRFTKIGKRITVDIDIAASAFTHSTAGGYMRIQGLPYNCSSATGVQSLGSVVFSGVNKAGYSQVSASIDATNPTQVILFASGMGVTESLITPADMPSGSAKSIRLTLSYEVAW